MSDLINGEWWIDETGSAIYADGDNGDDNHETIVLRRCWDSLLEWLTLAELRTDWPKSVKECVLGFSSALRECYGAVGDDQPAMREAFCNAHDELCKRSGKNGFKIPKRLNDPASCPYDWFANRLKEADQTFDRDSFDACLGCEGLKDIRVMATVNWGWIRLRGTNADLPDFSDKTLDRLIRGLDDAYPDFETSQFRDTEWNLEVWEKYVESARPACFLVGIPYAELLDGKTLRGDSVRFAGELTTGKRS